MAGYGEETERLGEGQPQYYLVKISEVSDSCIHLKVGCKGKPDD